MQQIEDNSLETFQCVSVCIWVPKANGEIFEGSWYDALQCTPMGSYKEMRIHKAEGFSANGAICLINQEVYALVRQEQFQVKVQCLAKQNESSWKAEYAPATLLTGFFSANDSKRYGLIKWDGRNNSQRNNSHQWIRVDKITISLGKRCRRKQDTLNDIDGLFNQLRGFALEADEASAIVNKSRILSLGKAHTNVLPKRKRKRKSLCQKWMFQICSL